MSGTEMHYCMETHTKKKKNNIEIEVTMQDLTASK